MPSGHLRGVRKYMYHVHTTKLLLVLDRLRGGSGRFGLSGRSQRLLVDSLDLVTDPIPVVEFRDMGAGAQPHLMQLRTVQFGPGECTGDAAHHLLTAAHVDLESRSVGHQLVG